MMIIGERINGTFTDVRQAIDQKDKRVVQELAKKQTEAGATYLDVNVGTAAADQEAAMQWLIETIQETCGTPLSLDSQKPRVIAAGLKAINAENGVILNSTLLNRKSDEEILDTYIEMANQAGPKASIIALTMDKNGVPQDIDTRVAVAADIVSTAIEKGFDTQRLFIDPIILPVKVPNAQVQPGNILAAMQWLIETIQETCGTPLSLDSAIVDALDRNLMNVVAAAEMLMNKQIYSDSFLKAYAGAN